MSMREGGEGMDPWPQGWGPPGRSDPIETRSVQGLCRLSTCPTSNVDQFPGWEVKIIRDSLLYPPTRFEKRGGMILEKECVEKSFRKMRGCTRRWDPERTTRGSNRHLRGEGCREESLPRLPGTGRVEE